MQYECNAIITANGTVVVLAITIWSSSVSANISVASSYADILLMQCMSSTDDIGAGSTINTLMTISWCKPTLGYPPMLGVSCSMYIYDRCPFSWPCHISTQLFTRSLYVTSDSFFLRSSWEGKSGTFHLSRAFRHTLTELCTWSW